ncbi:MAG: Spy/CpxP family protein refolding chaperone, partial [Pseudolabrys sp.]
QPRVAVQDARRGRFAAPFAERRALLAGGANAAQQVRVVRDHPRRAWRRGYRAGFVAWFGPVFWPYAYSDIFDYTFWPYGYDDGYWAYAYDDFFDGVFWGEGGPPDEYVEVEPGAPAAAPRANYAAVQNLCKQPGSGVTAWPFAEIEKKVGLNDEQKALLADIKKAAADAAATFKASCPPDDAFPMTPPGRLQTMRARLNATLEAVQIVRPPLEKFYDSLSDEQKERFNQIGPQQTQQASAEAREAQDIKSCKDPKQGLSNLPIEKIEDAVRPTDAQFAKLDALEKATTEAVGILQAACPEDAPLTPPGRLEAIEKRLQAMVDAADAVKPALEDFYASLSGEQKARFNRIGRTLAQSQ